MDVLGVDGLLQPRQLPTKVARPREPSLEQPGLDQPLKFCTPPLNCGSPAGMETGSTPKHRHSRITRERTFRRPPAG